MDNAQGHQATHQIGMGSSLKNPQEVGLLVIAAAKEILSKSNPAQIIQQGYSILSFWLAKNKISQIDIDVDLLNPSEMVENGQQYGIHLQGSAAENPNAKTAPLTLFPRTFEDPTAPDALPSFSWLTRQSRLGELGCNIRDHLADQILPEHDAVQITAAIACILEGMAQQNSIFNKTATRNLHNPAADIHHHSGYDFVFSSISWSKPEKEKKFRVH